MYTSTTPSMTVLYGHLERRRKMSEAKANNPQQSAPTQVGSTIQQFNNLTIHSRNPQHATI